MSVTDDDEDHEEDLNARSETSCEEGGVRGRAEHVAMD